MLYHPVPDDPAQWAEPAVGREPPWPARDLARLEPMAAVGAPRQQHKHEGGEAVLATLRALELRGRSAAARAGYQATVR